MSFFFAISASLLVGAVIAFGTPAGASAGVGSPLWSSNYSREHDTCLAGAHDVPSKVLSCNGAEIERQDLRLNEAYRIVMARLNAQQRIVLRDYERRWLALRDRQCAQEASTKPGQIDEIAYSRCVLVEVASRREWVEKYQP